MFEYGKDYSSLFKSARGSYGDIYRGMLKAKILKKRFLKAMYHLKLSKLSLFEILLLLQD